MSRGKKIVRTNKPEAPDFEKTQQPDHPKRSFLKLVWTSLGLVALAEVLFLGFSFIFPPGKKHRKKDQNLVIPAGSVDSYTPGTVTAFTRGFFYLTCLKDGGFLAFSSKCTHLGCTLLWDTEKTKFICPCHASSFDICGMVLSAPAPRPLDRYPVKIENRMIFVDTSQKLKRKRFNPKDVVYADHVKTGNADNQEQK